MVLIEKEEFDALIQSVPSNLIAKKVLTFKNSKRAVTWWQSSHKSFPGDLVCLSSAIGDVTEHAYYYIFFEKQNYRRRIESIYKERFLPKIFYDMLFEMIETIDIVEENFHPDYPEDYHDMLTNFFLANCQILSAEEEFSSLENMISEVKFFTEQLKPKDYTPAMVKRLTRTMKSEWKPAIQKVLP